MRVLQRGNVNATEGVIWKQLLAFFFPLWFGTFFQQLYNTVDTVVVGRFVGKAALAAVGCTSTVVNLTVGIFTGISSGAVVVIAQQFGARRPERVHKGVHTAMLLGVLLGGGFMVIGFLAAPWILRTMGTTSETLADAQLYLRIYFLGMIPNVVYNMGTGVFRAIGDSKRPLYFLMAASLCNIVLDLILVLGFQLGVLGVAIATVFSQLLSAVLVVFTLMWADGQPYQLFPRQMCLEIQSLKEVLRLGIPAALQSVMYNISNIIIQAAINSFGTSTVAAWTAYGKVDVIFWMSLSSMGLAITTFAGQNFGAGKIDRLKKGVRVAIWMSTGFAVVFSAVIIVFARPILSAFTPDADVLNIGVTMVYLLAPCFFTYVPVELLAGAIRGAGKSLAPTLITLFGVCALRLIWLLAVVPFHKTLPMIELSYPITWTVTSVGLLIYYWRGHWLKAK